jgi:acyl-CoA thioesterase-1
MFSIIQKKLIQICTVIFLLLSLNVFAQTHSAPKSILVLGDSLSAEYGLERGTGWVALLEKKLEKKGYTYSVMNASISGETTSGGLARIKELLTLHHPQIVIIELGGNDALRGLNLVASEKNFREMIRSCQSQNAQVLLVAMKIPPNYGKTYTEQFFALYERIARESKSGLVPFFLQGVADKPELFQQDRIHLLAAAHPTMMENVWIPLQKYLKK